MDRILPYIIGMILALPIVFINSKQEKNVNKRLERIEKKLGIFDK